MSHKVLVIGNAAREHVIAEALLKSSQKPKLVAYMGTRNPALSALSVDLKVGKVTDAKDIVKFAKNTDVDFAFIGPEAPLAAGVVDALLAEGIPAVGPVKEAARLESDKGFLRTLMQKHGCPGNIKFYVCTNIEEIKDAIRALNGQVAVKPAGLTGGKGVKVSGQHLKNEQEAIDYAREIIEKKIGGEPKVIIEELLLGEEFTIQSFVDGKTVVPTPAAQDFKRAYEGDEGPNTGGMGSYSDANHLLPFLEQKDYETGVEIIKSIIDAFTKETGLKYKGILYGQFMKTNDGIRIIESNVRFGDPEAMNVLPILKSDFLDISYAIMNGTLSETKVEFDNKATAVRYIVPEGYPVSPKADEKLDVNSSEIEKLGVKLYYASVRKSAGNIYTTRSRSIALVGIANTIPEAADLTLKAIGHIKGPIFYRRDIGSQEMIEKKAKRFK